MFKHTKEDEDFLVRMSPLERESRLEIKAIRGRDSYIKDYSHWILSYNEYPYEGVKDHLVLWFKWKKKTPHDLAWVEFGDICEEYGSYIKLINGNHYQSCPIRYHAHFILL